MQQVIFLQGPTQSGKTSTLKKVARLLHSRDVTVHHRAKKWVECLEVLSFQGRKIGLTSRSDKFKELKLNLDFLLREMQCDVVVAAINEKMKGVKELLQEMEAEGYQIEFVHKYPIFQGRDSRDLQELANEKMANSILERMESCLQNIS